MRMESLLRTGSALAIILAMNLFTQADAQEAKTTDRVANKIDQKGNATHHPLDPALRIARRGLIKLDAEIHDYTATLIRRERVNGVLKGPEFSSIKVLNPRVTEKGETPFSIYMHVNKPAAVANRECIFVKGHNNDKLIAHEGSGLLKHITVELDPKGSLAMKGNRYPITQAGIRTLITKLIEKGEHDRQRDECEVKFFKNAKINGRSCTVIRVLHPQKRDYFDFFKVEIFIDNEHQVPIRYAAWTWPAEENGKPVLEEEYTYINFTPNVGLTEKDFSRQNAKYKFN